MSQKEDHQTECNVAVPVDSKSPLFCKKERLFKCEYGDCGKTYYSRGYLARHIKQHESSGKWGKIIPRCDICDKDYITSWGLRKHLTTHHVPAVNVIHIESAPLKIGDVLKESCLNVESSFKRQPSDKKSCAINAMENNTVDILQNSCLNTGSSFDQEQSGLSSDLSAFNVADAGKHGQNLAGADLGKYETECESVDCQTAQLQVKIEESSQKQCSDTESLPEQKQSEIDLKASDVANVGSISIEKNLEADRMEYDTEFVDCGSVVIAQKSEGNEQKCLICNKMYSSVSLLRRHITRNHQGPKNEHYCKECNLYFCSRGGMRRHIRKNHCCTKIDHYKCSKEYMVVSCPITCCICRIPFAVVDKESNNENKRHECDSCGFVCYLRAKFVKHVMKCCKIWRCRYRNCNRQYSYKRNRDQHENVCHRKKEHRWQCFHPGCGKIILHKSSFKKHLCLHEEGKIKIKIKINSKLKMKYSMEKAFSLRENV